MFLRDGTSSACGRLICLNPRLSNRFPCPIGVEYTRSQFGDLCVPVIELSTENAGLS
jgi:hypothetical protein